MQDLPRSSFFNKIIQGIGNQTPWVVMDNPDTVLENGECRFSIVGDAGGSRETVAHVYGDDDVALQDATIMAKSPEMVSLFIEVLGEIYRGSPSSLTAQAPLPNTPFVPPTYTAPSAFTPPAQTMDSYLSPLLIIRIQQILAHVLNEEQFKLHVQSTAFPMSVNQTLQPLPK